MTANRAASGLRGQLRRFAGDRDGVSAVEFAIVLPFMLLMYIGGAELGDGLAIQFKVTEAARTVTDLTTQYVSVDSTTISGILGATSQVVAPYPSTRMVVTVSEITTDTKGQGSITWSCSLNGTPRLVNQSFTLPTALQTPSISLIMGEVTYPYTPQLGYVITGTVNIYQNTYFYPRLSTQVIGPTTGSGAVSCN
jgi:Flp pilus assembly protein TadG